MYVVISKTTLSAVALLTSLPDPEAFGDSWIVPVPEGYGIRLPTYYEGYSVLGTTWTLEQILSYISKYETYLAKQEEAINAAISQVNGTPISELTSAQLRILLLILCADRGWITFDNKIQVSSV